MITLLAEGMAERESAFRLPRAFATIRDGRINC